MPQYFSLVVKKKKLRQMFYFHLRSFGRRKNFGPISFSFGKKPNSFGLVMKIREIPTFELDKLFGFEQAAGHLESELASKRPYHCVFYTTLVGQAIRCSQET